MYKTFFWDEICLKILFTVWILQMRGDPRLREDDQKGFRHVRVGEHPLEECTRISPEPALWLDWLANRGSTNLTNRGPRACRGVEWAVNKKARSL